MLSLDVFSHVRDERLRLLLAHWLERTHGRPMPARTQLDPAALKPVLPFMWICDYEPADDVLRYRLAGESINALHGSSLRGLSMATLFQEETRDEVMQRMLSVVKDRVILHQIGDVYSTRMHMGSGERLILPLAGDGETANAVVGGTIFDWGGGSGSLAHQEMTATFTTLSGDSREGKVRCSYDWGRKANETRR